MSRLLGHHTKQKRQQRNDVRAARAIESSVSDATVAIDSSEQTVLSSAVSWMSTAMATNWHRPADWLRVIQVHRKQNHWTDHTRLSSSRVIWRSIKLWLEMWVRGQLRSLKIVRFESNGFLFTLHNNYGRIFSHFGDIQRQKMIWPWNLDLGLFKVIENGAYR